MHLPCHIESFRTGSKSGFGTFFIFILLSPPAPKPVAIHVFALQEYLVLCQLHHCRLADQLHVLKCQGLLDQQGNTLNNVWTPGVLLH